MNDCLIPIKHTHTHTLIIITLITNLEDEKYFLGQLDASGETCNLGISSVRIQLHQSLHKWIQNMMTIMDFNIEKSRLNRKSFFKKTKLAGTGPFFKIM